MSANTASASAGAAGRGGASSGSASASASSNLQPGSGLNRAPTWARNINFGEDVDLDLGRPSSSGGGPESGVSSGSSFPAPSFHPSLAFGGPLPMGRGMADASPFGGPSTSIETGASHPFRYSAAANAEPVPPASAAIAQSRSGGPMNGSPSFADSPSFVPSKPSTPSNAPPVNGTAQGSRSGTFPGVAGSPQGYEQPQRNGAFLPLHAKKASVGSGQGSRPGTGNSSARIPVPGSMPRHVRGESSASAGAPPGTAQSDRSTPRAAQVARMGANPNISPVTGNGSPAAASSAFAGAQGSNAASVDAAPSRRSADWSKQDLSQIMSSADVYAQSFGLHGVDDEGRNLDGTQDGSLEMLAGLRGPGDDSRRDSYGTQGSSSGVGGMGVKRGSVLSFQTAMSGADGFNSGDEEGHIPSSLESAAGGAVLANGAAKAPILTRSRPPSRDALRGSSSPSSSAVLLGGSRPGQALPMASEPSHGEEHQIPGGWGGPDSWSFQPQASTIPAPAAVAPTEPATLFPSRKTAVAPDATATAQATSEDTVGREPPTPTATSANALSESQPPQPAPQQLESFLPSSETTSRALTTADPGEATGAKQSPTMLTGGAAVAAAAAAASAAAAAARHPPPSSARSPPSAYIPLGPPGFQERGSIVSSASDRTQGSAAARRDGLGREKHSRQGSLVDPTEPGTLPAFAMVPLPPSPGPNSLTATPLLVNNKPLDQPVAQSPPRVALAAASPALPATQSQQQRVEAPAYPQPQPAAPSPQSMPAYAQAQSSPPYVGQLPKRQSQLQSPVLQALPQRQSGLQPLLLSQAATRNYSQSTPPPSVPEKETPRVPSKDVRVSIQLPPSNSQGALSDNVIPPPLPVEVAAAAPQSKSPVAAQLQGPVSDFRARPLADVRTNGIAMEKSRSSDSSPVAEMMIAGGAQNAARKASGGLPRAALAEAPRASSAAVLVSDAASSHSIDTPPRENSPPPEGEVEARAEWERAQANLVAKQNKEKDIGKRNTFRGQLKPLQFVAADQAQSDKRASGSGSPAVPTKPKRDSQASMSPTALHPPPGTPTTATGFGTPTTPGVADVPALTPTTATNSSRRSVGPGGLAGVGAAAAAPEAAAVPVAGQRSSSGAMMAVPAAQPSSGAVSTQQLQRQQARDQRRSVGAINLAMGGADIVSGSNGPYPVFPSPSTSATRVGGAGPGGVKQYPGNLPQRSLVAPFELQQRPDGLLSGLIGPDGVRRSPDDPEVCLECMMRDEDMIDVHVVGPGLWERESDRDFEEACRIEGEEDQRKERERELRRELGSAANSVGTHGGTIESAREGSIGPADVSQLKDLVPLPSRPTGVKIRVKRVAKGDPLTAERLKLHTQMNPPASSHRWRTLQSFLAVQAKYIAMDQRIRAENAERARQQAAAAVSAAAAQAAATGVPSTAITQPHVGPQDYDSRQIRMDSRQHGVDALLGKTSVRGAQHRTSAGSLLKDGLIIEDEQLDDAARAAKERDIAAARQARRKMAASAPESSPLNSPAFRPSHAQLAHIQTGAGTGNTSSDDERKGFSPALDNSSNYNSLPRRSVLGASTASGPARSGSAQDLRAMGPSSMLNSPAGVSPGSSALAPPVLPFASSPTVGGSPNSRHASRGASQLSQAHSGSMVDMHLGMDSMDPTQHRIAQAGFLPGSPIATHSPSALNRAFYGFPGDGDEDQQQSRQSPAPQQPQQQRPQPQQAEAELVDGRATRMGDRDRAVTPEPYECPDTSMSMGRKKKKGLRGFLAKMVSGNSKDGSGASPSLDSGSQRRSQSPTASPRARRTSRGYDTSAELAPPPGIGGLLNKARRSTSSLMSGGMSQQGQPQQQPQQHAPAEASRSSMDPNGQLSIYQNPPGMASQSSLDMGPFGSGPLPPPRSNSKGVTQSGYGSQAMSPRPSANGEASATPTMGGQKQLRTASSATFMSQTTRGEHEGAVAGQPGERSSRQSFGADGTKRNRKRDSARERSPTLSNPPPEVMPRRSSIRDPAVSQASNEVAPPMPSMPARHSFQALQPSGQGQRPKELPVLPEGFGSGALSADQPQLRGGATSSRQIPNFAAIVTSPSAQQMPENHVVNSAGSGPLSPISASGGADASPNAPGRASSQGTRPASISSLSVTSISGAPRAPPRSPHRTAPSEPGSSIVHIGQPQQPMPTPQQQQQQQSRGQAPPVQSQNLVNSALAPVPQPTLPRQDSAPQLRTPTQSQILSQQQAPLTPTQQGRAKLGQTQPAQQNVGWQYQPGPFSRQLPVATPPRDTLIEEGGETLRDNLDRFDMTDDSVGELSKSPQRKSRFLKFPFGRSKRDSDVGNSSTSSAAKMAASTSISGRQTSMGMTPSTTTSSFSLRSRSSRGTLDDLARLDRPKASFGIERQRVMSTPTDRRDLPPRSQSAMGKLSSSRFMGGFRSRSRAALIDEDSDDD